YTDIAGARIRSLIGSPALFVMRSLGDVVLVCVEAVVPVLLVSRFGSIAGWTAAQAAMLIGAGRGAEGLAFVFGRGIDPVVFSETVRLGRFDQVLTRPVSPLGWLLTSEIEMRFVFRAAAGAGIV